MLIPNELPMLLTSGAVTPRYTPVWWTDTTTPLLLALLTTRISAFLVWVSAFRVSALAFLLFDGEHPRNPRGHAMARPAVMPFKNVDGEPCFACGETENTRWYCAYDPGQIRRWLCRTP